MTYESNLEKSQMEGVPELYDFYYGGIYDRYTSWSEDITFQGVTYKRATIQRSGFSVNTEFGKVSMTVKTPLVPTLSTYIANQPVERTKIVVYRAILSDTSEYRVLFSGDVQRVSFKGSVCQATCEMQSFILSQKLPNIIHQSYCNHQVFDEGCILDWAAWREAATITVIDEDKYSSALFGTHVDGYFTGGQLVNGNDARYIINHVGNDVWLHIPFDSRVAVGTELYALPGCDGAPSTCIDKFNNFSNHLSMPYIPSSNPVMWGFK